MDYFSTLTKYHMLQSITQKHLVLQKGTMSHYCAVQYKKKKKKKRKRFSSRRFTYSNQVHLTPDLLLTN
jgi:hypothetical protein